MCSVLVFFFKQKPAYEMRISDWSSDVCSSDLCRQQTGPDTCRRLGIAERGMAAVDGDAEILGDGFQRDAGNPRSQPGIEQADVEHGGRRPERWEERRVGEAGGSTGRFWWWP